MRGDGDGGKCGNPQEKCGNVVFHAFGGSVQILRKYASATCSRCR
jgi:hypothetical protein